MSQLGLDFTSAPMTVGRARELRDDAIVKVGRNADDKVAGWSDIAFAYLKVYAHQHEFFSPESVTEAALAYGIPAPHDARAWGGVYIRAKNDKIIAKSDRIYQRKFGHATISLLWQSLVYRG